MKEYDKAVNYGQVGASQAPQDVTPHLLMSQAVEAMTRAVQVGPEFIQKRFELLKSGAPINETMKHRIGLILTTVRLVDRAHLTEPLRAVIDRPEL